MGKFLATELVCRLTDATQLDIGERYGGITSAAVTTIRRKVRDGKYPIVNQMVRKLTRSRQSQYLGSSEESVGHFAVRMGGPHFSPPRLPS